MSRVRMVWMCLEVAAPAWLACAGGHPIPESERWATITHPGNSPYVYEAFPEGPVFSLGAVDHEYQIGRTEITGGEWVEFVNAYAPYVDPFLSDRPMFLSQYVYQTGPNTYAVSSFGENRAVEVSFHFAARYCNWLHNGKALTPEAFENGAYDTSTFVEPPDVMPPITDQVAHNPDARYWIPTQDEWVKAAHFDPNKNGPGQPGYWGFPTSSDAQPFGSPPELGGETSAGYDWYMGGYSIPEVAAYGDVQSPWGLWDLSGGVREWTESPDWQALTAATRVTEGSAWRDTNPDFSIILDSLQGWITAVPTSNIWKGFRIARAVPGVSSVSVFSCALVFIPRRRRSIHDKAHLRSCSRVVSRLAAVVR